jgi:GMP synthase-like glutamine amidotransferase
MRLHYLQHVPFENPGAILTWAARNGHSVTSTQLYADGSLPNLEEFDWLVVMGGPMNIYEEATYPWLAREKSLIRQAVIAGKVILGLCLGAQLIADVIGGKVTKNPHKEIGWFPVQLSEQARLSPLFSFFPPQPLVFQWHGDTFSVLPAAAVSIARSEACEHQAFVYRSRVFGFQFHLENTPAIIAGLIENCQDELIPDVYVQTPAELLAHPEYIEQDNRWLEEFLNRLETMYDKGEI